MSTIYEDISVVLGSVAGGNFFLQELPQEYDLPCAVFRVLHEEPIATLCSTNEEAIYEVGIYCWGDTFEESQAVEDEVRTALDADSTMVKWNIESPGEQFDPVERDFMQPVYIAVHQKF